MSESPVREPPTRVIVIAEMGVSKERRELVERAFQAGYARLQAITNTRPPTLTLRIYHRRATFLAELQSIGGFDEVSGFAQRGAPRPLQGQFYAPPDFSEVTICHELTHTFVEALSGKAYRRAKWLDEGFASYVGARYCSDVNDGRWLPIPREFWPRATRPFLPLNSMITEKQWGVLRREDSKATYNQAELTVRYLVEQFGESKVIHLIRATHDHTLDESLREVLGTDMRTIDEALRKLYGFP